MCVCVTCWLTAKRLGYGHRGFISPEFIVYMLHNSVSCLLLFRVMNNCCVHMQCVCMWISVSEEVK